MSRAPAAVNMTLAAMPLNGRQLFRLNQMIVFPLAVTLNSLLIVAMRKERSETLRAYAKVLSMNCVCDYIFATLSLLTDYQYEFTDGNGAVLLGGIYTMVPTHLHLFGFFICSWSLYLCMFIYTIIFYFRYCLVVRKVELSSASLAGLALLSISSAGTLSGWLTAAMYFRSGNVSCAEIFSHPLWTYGGASIDNCLAVDSKDVIFISYAAAFGVTATVSYSIILYFNVRIYRCVRANQAQFDVKTSGIQNQLSTLLIVQLLLPLACGLPASIMLAVGGLAHINVAGAHLLAMMFAAWIPALNPLVALIFIHNYRRRVRRMVCLPLWRSGFCSSRVSSEAAGLSSSIAGPINSMKVSSNY